MPLFSTVVLIRRATCLSLSRASSARLPSREVRTNTGPKSIFAKCSHCSSACTGQVWSLEPRPISTSRQPVLALSVSRAPPFLPSIGSQSSRQSPVCRPLPTIQADDFGAPETTRKPQQQNRPVAQPAQIEGQGGDHGEDVFRQDGLFLHRWAGVFAFDAGQHGGNVPVSCGRA